MTKRTGLWVLAAAVTAAVLGSRTAGADPARLVLAYYYVWYDEDFWASGRTADVPAVPYNSDDPAAIERHIRQARDAGVDGFILAWYGPGDRTDRNAGLALDAAARLGFKIALSVETDGPLLQNDPGRVAWALTAAGSRLPHPGYLRYDGRPVVFFWRVRALPVEIWAQIRAAVDPGRTQLWVAEGDDFGYLRVFDAQHGYSIAWAADPGQVLQNWLRRFRAAVPPGQARIFAATVMPGYDDSRLGRPDGFVRDRENGAYYRRSWEAALAAGSDWVVITSFNEWAEGSQIEPARSYGNLYLDITRQYTARFRGAAAPVGAVGPAGPDWPIPGGHFYTQAGGGRGGFGVTDADGVLFWTYFQRFGGPQAVGYPISRRFVWDGFVVQAFQRVIFQWRPDCGCVMFVNVFDRLHDAGADGWLAAVRSVPPPAAWDETGKDWEAIIRDRLAVLNGRPAIRAAYFAAPFDPIQANGLPTTPVVDMGNHYVLRTQRVVFQEWKEDVPWARAGQVTVALGGEIAKELGLIPAAAAEPEPAN